MVTKAGDARMCLTARDRLLVKDKHKWYIRRI